MFLDLSTLIKINLNVIFKKILIVFFVYLHCLLKLYVLNVLSNDGAGSTIWRVQVNKDPRPIISKLAKDLNSKWAAMNQQSLGSSSHVLPHNSTENESEIAQVGLKKNVISAVKIN